MSIKNERVKSCFIFLMAACMVFGIASPSSGADRAKHLIIDVRTEAEWNNGHLEGAVLIPYESIEKKIGAVSRDKSARIHVYCRSGRRSRIAMESLVRLGYKDVVNLGSLEDAAKALKLKIIK